MKLIETETTPGEDVFVVSYADQEEDEAYTLAMDIDLEWLWAKRRNMRKATKALQGAGP